MKKLLIVFFFLPLYVLGQQSVPVIATQPNMTYEQLRHQLQQQVLNQYGHTSSSTVFEQNYLEKFNQWDAFWYMRTARNLPSGDNIMDAYARKMSQHNFNRNGLCDNADPNIFNGNWELKGPNQDPGTQQSLGIISGIWTDPTDPDIQIVSTYGGLFKRTAQNLPWENITDGAGVPGGLANVCFAVNPLNTDEIYVGTDLHRRFVFTWDGFEYGMGLYHTTDGGVTWSLDNSFFNFFNSTWKTIQKLSFAPGTDDLYVISNNKVLEKKSSVWTDITPAQASGTGFNNIKFSPTNSDVFYVCSVFGWPSNGAELWKHSIVGGNHVWTDLTPNLPTATNYNSQTDVFMRMSMNVSEASNGDLYVISNINHDWPPINPNTINNSIKLYRYTASTSSWSIVRNSLPSVNLIQHTMEEIEVSLSNPEKIYFGQTDAHYSSDGGQTSQQIGTYLGNPTHGDIRTIHIHSSDNVLSGINDIVFIGNDGGLSLKPNGIIPNTTTATQNINGIGLSISHFWGVACTKTGGDRVSGAVHNGTAVWHNGSWTLPLGIGDDYESYPDANDLQKVYVQRWNFQNENNTTLNNPYTNWLWSASPPGGDMNVRSPRMASPNNTRNIANSQLWESVSNGGWTQRSVNRTDPGIVLPGNLPSYTTLAAPNMGGCNDVLGTGKTVTDMDVNPNNPEFKWVVTRKGYVNKDANSCFSHYANDFAEIEQSHVFFYDDNSLANVDEKWKDATTNNDMKNFTLTSVCMDPNNPYRAFVGAGDIVWGQTGTAAQRVWYTENADENNPANIVWTDISKGLPPGIPIIDLVYQSGSNSIVYAATDLGIYRLEFDENAPANSEWVCFNQGTIKDFPTVPTIELEIDYCSGKLVAATHGRGLWESDLFYHNSTGNVPATSFMSNGGNTTWTGDRYVEGSITVEAGNTLIIQGTPTNPTTIHMPKYGRINVEKGGRLIIDGATITNGCGTQWHGIFLDGDPNLPQLPFSNQGVCILRNDAVIENSENGVANYWNSSGGVILASNTTFRNNRRSAAFLQYQGYNTGGFPRADRSSFTNCLFTATDDYPTNAPSFDYHVTMWAVDRIRFKGCQFKNLQSNPVNNLRGKGIYSLDASHMVESYCDPLNVNCTPVPSDFTQLDNAVEGLGYNGVSSVSVDQATFNKNAIGISLDGLDAPSITRNLFTVGYANPLINTYSIGTALFNNPYLRVEENTYLGIDVAPNLGAKGLWISNTGGNDNIVYKNIFNGLGYANIAQGYNENYSKFGGITYRHGLRYLCNTQNINQNDIVVTPATWPSPHGIHPIQAELSNLTGTGIAIEAAGNTFSHTLGGFDIDNTGSSQMWYYHTGGNTEPISFTSNVTLNGTLGAPACISNLGGNTEHPHEVDAAGLMAMKAEFLSVDASYINLLYNHQQLIDDGSTYQMVNNVTETWDDNAWTMRNNLLAKAPNVSIEALTEAARENILPAAMLLEVVLANPASARDEVFVKFLQFEAPTPLSQYMIDIIKSTRNGETYRTSLENTISVFQARRIDMAYKIIQAMMYDEEHIQI